MKEKNYSTYAVSLNFDKSSCDFFRGIINHFSKLVGNDYMIQNQVPPHLTLGMFHAKDEDGDKMDSLCKDFISRTDIPGHPFEINFDGTDFFSDKVIFLRPHSERLHFLNSTLHEFFLPHFESADNRNYLPENWVPHLALAVKLKHDQFEKIREACLQNRFHYIAKTESLALVRCNPYEEKIRFAFSK